MRQAYSSGNKMGSRKLTHDQLNEPWKRSMGTIHWDETTDLVGLALLINRVYIYGWIAVYSLRNPRTRKSKLDVKTIKCN